MGPAGKDLVGIQPVDVSVPHPPGSRFLMAVRSAHWRMALYWKNLEYRPASVDRDEALGIDDRALRKEDA
jgi:hypothetical protein